MSDSLVIRSDRAGLTTLTLNRPDKLNALTPGVFVELRAHLDAIAGDDSVGCVVLAGAGRSFCAGHDLGAIASAEPAPSPYFEPETIDALESLPKPTICRLHGHCFTGGLELALACDLLVAAESTHLGDTHGQWGLVPVWGMSVRKSPGWLNLFKGSNTMIIPPCIAMSLSSRKISITLAVW